MANERNYAEQIAAYLRTDPATNSSGVTVPSPPLLGTYDIVNDIYSGLASGGIYTRPLKLPDPDDNRGATPTAFSSQSGRMRPSIVVRIESMVHHPQYLRFPNAVDVNILTYMYAPSHDTGKIVLEQLRLRLNLLLMGQTLPTDQGPKAHISWDFTFGTKENHDEFEGSLSDFTRYKVSTFLAIEE